MWHSLWRQGGKHPLVARKNCRCRERPETVMGPEAPLFLPSLCGWSAVLEQVISANEESDSQSEADRKGRSRFFQLHSSSEGQRWDRASVEYPLEPALSQTASDTFPLSQPLHTHTFTSTHAHKHRDLYLTEAGESQSTRPHFEVLQHTGSRG